jgi:predicted nucleic acid-binding protein
LVRFWDTSALIPLLVAEAASDAMQQELQGDPELVVWWASPVECVSALSRRERDGLLKGSSLVVSLQRLDALSGGWREVQPASRVRQIATRLLRVHPLRAADALQLAAAIVASEDQPATLPFLTLDGRLAQAAEREGFIVVRPDRVA